MLYMVTFTINIPPMLAYIPYMDPMGYGCRINLSNSCKFHLITVITMGVSEKNVGIFFRARSPLGSRVLQWNWPRHRLPHLAACWPSGRGKDYSWNPCRGAPLAQGARRVGTWSVHGLGAHSCDYACMKIIDLTASVLLEFTR